MGSNSATKLASQQSIKAYVDAAVSTITLAQLTYNITLGPLNSVNYTVKTLFSDVGLDAGNVIVQVRVLDNDALSSTNGFYINSEGIVTIANDANTVRIINEHTVDTLTLQINLVRF